MGITHFDEAIGFEADLGHLRSRWTMLGRSADTVGIGANRIQVADGGWSTPAHEHGHEEEIFYILSGRGISWHDGKTAEIAAGDCILYGPGEGAHTVHGIDGLDLLAFGTRHSDESVGFPRQGRSLVGNRLVDSEPGSIDDRPAQWVREVEHGPPELPEPGERPATIVNVKDLEPLDWGNGRGVRSLRRNLGDAVGSVRAGLKHVEVAPGKQASPLHCHTIEEELFVVLDGDGALLLGDAEIPVRAGHVVGRPPATGVSHAFRAGDRGLTFLAYGTREPGDICYYPRSNKVSFRGIGVIARLEAVDYWDGED